MTAKIIPFPVKKKNPPFNKGVSFVTKRGVRIAESYGYLRPTGRYDTVEGEEVIEVYCVKTQRTDFVSVNLLTPFRIIDDLG